MSRTKSSSEVCGRLSYAAYVALASLDLSLRVLPEVLGGRDAEV